MFEFKCSFLAGAVARFQPNRKFLKVSSVFDALQQKEVKNSSRAKNAVEKEWANSSIGQLYYHTDSMPRSYLAVSKPMNYAFCTDHLFPKL